MDFDFLRRQGIAYAQKHSGAIWTDYNDHDPGVTILEHLAYVLTDLGYRTDFPISDLLYARDETGKVRSDETFFRSYEVLPSAPLTLTDYRKLIIDRISAVENVWIVPNYDHIAGYRGLYSVQLQLTEDLSAPEREDVICRVRNLLMSNRNLGEDLETIQILRTEPLVIEADIHLSPEADGEHALARILDVLTDLLSPPIQKYQQEDLLREGMGVSHVFDGPLPTKGFIRNEDLRSPLTSLNISNIREAVGRIEGVQYVAQMTVRKNGERIHGGEVPISKNAYLVLGQPMMGDNAETYPIRLFRNGMPIRLDLFYAQLLLRSLLAAKRSRYNPQLEFNEPAPVSRKRLADICAYFSVQRLFPQIYGIGSFGLPHRSNNEQKGRAKQLKGFLTLFEVVLASHLAQLGGLKHLFSLTSESGKSYYSQFPFDIPDVDLLLNPKVAESSGDKRRDMQKVLEELVAEFDNEGDRHNRFLDHLLARFGVVLDDELINRITLKDPGQPPPLHRLAGIKSRFLKNYVTFSRDRFKGYDYSAAPGKDDPDNVAGLKKALYALLDIAPKEHALSDIRGMAGIDLRPAPEEGAEGAERLFPLREMLTLGAKKFRYFLAYENRRYYLYFRKSPDQAREDLQPIYSAAAGKNDRGREDCLAFRDALIGKLERINEGSKGFYLVEHLLLRPVRKKKVKMVFRLPLQEPARDLAFKSLDFLHLEEWADIADDLLIFASNRQNYELVSSGRNSAQLLIRLQDVPVLQSEEFDPRDFQGSPDELVAREIARIRDKDPGLLNHLLDQEDQIFDSDRVDSGFYSQRLSVVLPAWPDTFQAGGEFRYFFRFLLSQIIPAHLRADLFWLSIRQMAVFEQAFERWKRLKAMQNLIQEMFHKTRSGFDEMKGELKSDWKKLKALDPDQEVIGNFSPRMGAKKYHDLLKAFEELMDGASYQLAELLSGYQDANLSASVTGGREV